MINENERKNFVFEAELRLTKRKWNISFLVLLFRIWANPENTQPSRYQKNTTKTARQHYSNNYEHKTNY